MLTRIIYRIIKQSADQYLDEDKFGFRKISDTRVAILALSLLIEKIMEKNNPTTVVFEDFGI